MPSGMSPCGGVSNMSQWEEADPGPAGDIIHLGLLEKDLMSPPEEKAVDLCLDCCPCDLLLVRQ